MKKIMIIIVLTFSLLFYLSLVHAERLNESDGKEVKLNTEQWKKLNTFFSNFSEVFLKSFEEGIISKADIS